MTLYSYPITVEREGKRYYAYSEDFPGIYGLGKSIEQAKKSILEAMRLYIRHCRKKGRPIPATRTGYADAVSVAVAWMVHASPLPLAVDPPPVVSSSRYSFS